jgi:hypothetical protein
LNKHWQPWFSQHKGRSQSRTAFVRSAPKETLRQKCRVELRFTSPQTIGAPMQRNDLLASYANKRTSLKLVADLSNHWGIRTQTYGYQSARIKVPYKSGADFWVHMSLIVKPVSTREAFSRPPVFSSADDYGPFHFELSEQRLTVIVPLNREDLWGTVKDKSTPLLYIDRSEFTRPLCQWDDSCLELRIWITSEAVRPPTLPEFVKGVEHTVSGGQFESNRRRH